MLLDASGSSATGLVLLALVAGAYFIPALIALTRKTSSTGAAIVVNVFLGWTVIGWVVALALAVSGTPRPRPGLRSALRPGSLSPDGYWEWDGQRWLPVQPPSGPPK